MMDEWLETEVSLLEDFHMRPIQEINRTAQKFKSEVSFHFGEKSCNAKSFLGILELAPIMNKQKQRTFKIKAFGIDAKNVIEAFLKMS